MCYWKLFSGSTKAERNSSANTCGERNTSWTKIARNFLGLAKSEHEILTWEIENLIWEFGSQ